MFEKYITQQFIHTLSCIEYGSVSITTPDDKVYSYAGNHPGVFADITLHDWKAIPALAAKGDIGFAEGYRQGWWSSNHLTDLFYLALQNEKVLNSYIYGNVFSRMASRFAYSFTQNSLKGSRKNIHAHYDLGNSFYQLWLDPTMTYSSAIFFPNEEDLVAAQYRKYDRILDRFGESGNVLEIGCGWGGFADRALERKDYCLKGLTISHEQYNYARNRLSNKAQIALEDYRMQQGKFDYIVSIEMFEAVGEKYWSTYFNKIKAMLSEHGKALIQTITIAEPYFDQYRRSGDAIRTYIFPGGMLPTPYRFEQGCNKAELQVTDRFSFGQDYARTLEHWLMRFEGQLHNVRNLGFDEKFIRIWRFYLSCCIASFKTGRTSVMQMELQHAA